MEETIYEMTDLMYHGMVWMVEAAQRNEGLREPGRRHIIDHKVKQEKTTQ